jgi:hypothetical protein
MPEIFMTGPGISEGRGVACVGTVVGVSGMAGSISADGCTVEGIASCLQELMRSGSATIHTIFRKNFIRKFQFEARARNKFIIAAGIK